MFAEAEEIFKVHQQMNQKHITIKKILVFKPDFYVIILFVRSSCSLVDPKEGTYFSFLLR